MILAQRLGLSRFHSIKNADAEAIKNINAFGGRQQKLFGEKADTSRARLVVWIEDGDEATMKSKNLLETVYCACTDRVCRLG